jgi:hypothetical protein
MPHAAAERTVTGAALDAVDLTIVTSWADAVAEAMEHTPDATDALMADARPGAPWRRELDVPEPSAPLAQALNAVADAVAAVDAASDGDRDAAVLALLRNASDDGDAPVGLARAVLRSALEARQDARSVVSHHG